ncbi:MAG: PAS/PAC sensor hybrid histidine kinase [Candidatus Moranbacteria bacterium GW2011_GWE1_49_15]|nr:MAG: PAS/PAC sensor hybrid histidine kinase [Candidatus Moranbacteria bacterium GW2011_GWE2_47_10]KKW06700.1 MAG: PAS/PAC sensor hybrid histidine kinase [Candidatus Moranbacteria bacterium GW2011_GWE1_49_15]HBP00749.1 hypothetical protein [Candidatus Moranbacteria bacterium]
MISNLIKRGVDFTKKNPTILYSLVLIVAVTAIIFFNSYYSLRKFESSTDKLLQSKALLAGNVLKTFGSDLVDERENLQAKIDAIKEQDSEIKDIAILKPGEEGGAFSVVASTAGSDNVESQSTLYAILWSEGEAIAFLDHDEQGRFWNVGDVIRDMDGKKTGIALFRLSLSEHDRFVQSIIDRVYFVALASLVVVLLLVVNHARLFKYELKATKLEEIDKMKDDFISMASHELKSPLTAIRGYIGLLNDNLQGKPDSDEAKNQRRYLENMDISATRLRDLVEDLLEVSKLEQNRLPIRPEDMDLTAIVQGSVNEMGVSAQQKKLQLVNGVKKNLRVSADPERVKQILVNLLSNAIKYTPEGKVEIKSKQDDKFVYVTVADTGLGMSAENMKKLFSKFYRVKSEETSKISGTGLGLWISKEIALKMGGDLTVESIEGVGSHFTLKLRKV